MDAVKHQLATDRKLQLEKEDLDQRLCVAEMDDKEPDTSKTQLDVHQELQLEKEELERRLRDAQENCAAFEKELHETNMELGGLKQNLEEAEQFEQQNVVLVNHSCAMSEDIADTEHLKKNLKAMAQKDTLLREVQLELDDARTQLSRREDKAGTEVKLSRELEKTDTIINLRSELESVRKDLMKSEDMVTKKDAELSNVIDDNNNNNIVIVENLRKELMASKKKFALLEERLDSSKLSDWTSLIEVATSREKARFLKVDLDELEEKINGDHQEVIDVDRKRDSEEVLDSPRKRVKTRTDDDDDDSDSDDSDDDDAIVL